MQNENTNLRNDIERAHEAVYQAQNEMEQYKSRAQRILQEKEDLINLQHSSLKDPVENNMIDTYNAELK